MLDPHKLRDRRKAKQLSQGQLAERCNALSRSGKTKVTPAMISRFETPDFIIDPQLSTVEKLARALECEVADLLSPGSPDKRSGARPGGAAPAEPVVVQPPPNSEGIGYT